MEGNEVVAIAMIDNSQKLNLSLSETNERKQTPLFLACQLHDRRIVLIYPLDVTSSIFTK